MDSKALIWILFMLPRYILMGRGGGLFTKCWKFSIFLPFPYRNTVGESGKNDSWGKVCIDPYNFCLSCVLLFCLKQGFRISSQFLSSMRSVFQASMIQNSKVHLLGPIDQTYKSVENRMTHHKVIALKKNFP